MKYATSLGIIPLSMQEVKNEGESNDAAEKMSV